MRADSSFYNYDDIPITRAWWKANQIKRTKYVFFLVSVDEEIVTLENVTKVAADKFEIEGLFSVSEI